MRMLRPLACALAVQLVALSHAGAQACTGNTPFANGRIALGAVGNFMDGGNRFGAVGAYGAPKSWYATATVGSTSAKGGGGSLTDFGGSLGYQIPLGDSQFEFCPMAMVGYASATGIKSTTWGFGGGIGWPNHVSDDFDFIPAVGLQYNSFNTTVTGISGSFSGNSTTYWLNAGIILNKQWSIVPGVSKSSTSGSKAVFNLGVNFNFGT